MGQSIVTKNSKFRIICVAPDVCMTPAKTGYPIPYPITHDLGKTKRPSRNVFLNKKAAFLHNASYVDGAMGDQPGKGGGVISQVTGKISHSVMKSSNVYANNRPTVRTMDNVWMNWKKPFA
ncbi:MAG: PAAR-like domain-containing protein [Casimicrobium sp.]